MDNRPPGLTWIVLAALLLSGCGEEAQVRRYQVPHEPAAVETPPAAADATATKTAAATPQRVLAAIIPAGERAWFVKATGSPEAIDTQKGAFEAFLRSWQLEAAADASPRWTEPEGWKTRPTAGPMRFATLDASGVEVSVSVLPLPSGQPWGDYLLANVNRWRGQLQLEPATLEAVQREAQTVPVGSLTATTLDLLGQSTPGAPPSMRAGGPPVANGSPPVAPAPAPTPVTPAGGPTASEPGLRYALPEGWTPGRSGPFRLAAFEVQRDGEKAEVTLSALGAAAGSLLDNVNRWRGQISLPPISEADLAKVSSEMKLQDQTGQWVDLSGEGDAVPAQAILAFVLPQGDRTIFVKMMGNGQLVRSQKAAFEQFVRSLQFTTN